MRSIMTGAVALLLAAHAHAQTAPDPGLAAAKARFETLDMEARRAIQRDLVWAGGFTGSASGEFGALTFAALKRFETGANLKVDAILETNERAALAKAAQGARDAVGFKIEVEKGTGIRIGVPTKLLTKRSKGNSGQDRWQDGADKVTLDLQTGKPEDTLPALFDKGTDAKVTTRKVTYKLLRPEFFVISGETAGGKFFRRMEKGPDGTLRGFSIGYDKGVAAAVDPLVIAIATSFEAFPSSRPAVAATGPTAGAPASSGIAPPAVPKRKRITGLVVAEGKIVTSETAAKACKSLALEGPARMMATLQKVEGGLALIVTATPRARPVALGGTLTSAGLLLQRDLDGRLLAAPAEVDGTLVLAPLQEGGAGAGIFDATGRAAGLVISEPATKFAVAGTLPVLRHRVAKASEVAAFAGVTLASGERKTLSAGEIAEQAGSGVVSLYCE